MKLNLKIYCTFLCLSSILCLKFTLFANNFLWQRCSIRLKNTSSWLVLAPILAGGTKRNISNAAAAETFWIVDVLNYAAHIGFRRHIPVGSVNPLWNERKKQQNWKKLLLRFNIDSIVRHGKLYDCQCMYFIMEIEFVDAWMKCILIFN